MARLKDYYKQDVAPALMKKFSYKSVMQIPKLDKIVINVGAGEAKDICPLDGDGNGLEIGFNNKYLMDALKAAPADKVRLELTTGVSPCVILPTEGEENFLYMVLPVRLKAGE